MNGRSIRRVVALGLLAMLGTALLMLATPSPAGARRAPGGAAGGMCTQGQLLAHDRELRGLCSAAQYQPSPAQSQAVETGPGWALAGAGALALVGLGALGFTRIGRAQRRSALAGRAAPGAARP